MNWWGSTKRRWSLPKKPVNLTRPIFRLRISALGCGNTSRTCRWRKMKREWSVSSSRSRTGTPPIVLASKLSCYQPRPSRMTSTRRCPTKYLMLRVRSKWWHKSSRSFNADICMPRTRRIILEWDSRLRWQREMWKAKHRVHPSNSTCSLWTQKETSSRWEMNFKRPKTNFMR